MFRIQFYPISVGVVEYIECVRDVAMTKEMVGGAGGGGVEVGDGVIDSDIYYDSGSDGDGYEMMIVLVLAVAFNTTMTIGLVMTQEPGFPVVDLFMHCTSY